MMIPPTRRPPSYGPPAAGPVSPCPPIPTWQGIVALSLSQPPSTTADLVLRLSGVFVYPGGC